MLCLLQREQKRMLIDTVSINCQANWCCTLQQTDVTINYKYIFWQILSRVIYKYISFNNTIMIVMYYCSKNNLHTVLPCKIYFASLVTDQVCIYYVLQITKKIATCMAIIQLRHESICWSAFALKIDNKSLTTP